MSSYLWFLVFDLRAVLQINLKVDKDYPILAFGGGYLHAVSAIDGEILWKKDFTAEGYDSLHFIFQ